MKKTFSTVTGIMLALMMLFVSCEQGGVSKAQLDSRDLVTVSFTKVEAKSITSDNIGTVDTPLLQNLWFQYKAVKTSGEGASNVQGQKTTWTNLSGQGLNSTIQLSRGEWTLYLRGFATETLRTAAGTSETASTQAVFEGSDVFAVGSTLTERAQTVDIGLDFTNPSGTGSYELSVAIPEAYASQAAKVKVTITPASGSAQDKTFAYSAGTTSNKFSFTGLGNGVATVKVEYLDSAGVAIGDAHTGNTLIMTDMTTKGSASISEDNTFTISFAGAAVNGSAESAPSTQPEYKTIGGAIFYDAGSNGAIYKFYDSGKNLIDDTSLAALQSAKYYTVSGTPSNDRFYVVYPTVLNSGNDLYWGFRANIDIMPVNGGVVSTGTGVGTGKSATAAILSYINTYASGDSASATMPGASEDISHTSPGGYNLYKNCGTTYKYIWDEIRALNTSAPEGLSDWYIPSKDELSQLATNKAIIISTAAQVYSKINSGYIWSSSAHTSDLNAWYWTSYSSGKISYDNRNNYNSGIACRSF